MFIISKRNFKIRRADGEVFRIQKDFVGTIPADVAGHPLIRSAIACGWIATPATTADAALEKADEKAAVKAAKTDIRPDAERYRQKQKRRLQSQRNALESNI